MERGVSRVPEELRAFPSYGCVLAITYLGDVELERSGTKARESCRERTNENSSCEDYSECSAGLPSRYAPLSKFNEPLDEKSIQASPAVLVIGGRRRKFRASEKMADDFNLSYLKELERERVLEVLYRDQTLQKAEEERIRKLKTHLQQLRWKGAKSASREYEERSCARCQKALGRLLNRGAVCHGCSHRVCEECQIYRCSIVWKCTVCNAHGEVKIKTGEWFHDEREKKFPSAGN
ncbi:unnamed protein product, partial [Ranitomeya imitator]